MNYICDDVERPVYVTFEDGRVIKLVTDEDGPFLSITPACEYPKPCGICDGVIQSMSDLDWHGYGNCREIPEAMLNEMGLAHVIHGAPAPRWHSTEPFDVLYRDWYVKAQEAVKS